MLNYLMGGLVLAAQILACNGPNEEISLEVQGARRLSIHCGGEQTIHEPGNRTTFVPDGPRCRVEAAVSPVMPLHGELIITQAGHYTCSRRGMDLQCGPGAARLKQ